MKTNLRNDFIKTKQYATEYADYVKQWAMSTKQTDVLSYEDWAIHKFYSLTPTNTECEYALADYEELKGMAVRIREIAESLFVNRMHRDNYDNEEDKINTVNTNLREIAWNLETKTLIYDLSDLARWTKDELDTYCE